MRTLVVGDIHGKRILFERLLEQMKYQPGKDRLVLIGDLVDRGEDSRGVVERAIELKKQAPQTVTVIRGNHEVMMLSALAQPGSEEVELWYINGGIETLQSYLDEEGNLTIPEEHCNFIADLPTWDEDEHAIYVHASLVEDGSGGFFHPKETPDHPALIWARNRHFFAEYGGKTVVFGHTITGMLFGEREKVWLRDHLIGIDTGAYLTGVLSAIELPSRNVFSVSEDTGQEEPQGLAENKKKFWL
ncbi:MAG: serine/threonine protein phosphatase [Acidobacteria bacterium]|nr:serine/threonine protein phosphatase [Acidobacteriota bacterium]MBI3424322.1 serine/threonine protein phosphatase [Acidobacteriota bacterium]